MKTTADVTMFTRSCASTQVISAAGEGYTGRWGERTDKLPESRWIKREWVSGLELSWLMLDYYEHSMDEQFLQQTAVPYAHQIVTFFDEHYSVNEEGKLLMHPAQVLETWWDCTNPMSQVAGLRAVTARLLELPEDLVSAERRRYWRMLRKRLPELPTREVKGTKMLAPAEKFAQKKNTENPELYTVFPFRLVDLESAGRSGINGVAEKKLPAQPIDRRAR